MFKGKKKSADTDANINTSSAPSGGSNSIVAGTSFTGDISANNDIRIDGDLNGNLTCQGRVIIGSSGSVVGEIQCTNAVIEGRFEGKLNVTELLNVKEAASITGEIATEKLLVQAGALFNVTCKMGGQTFASFSE